jgi:hypothetical protein
MFFILSVIFTDREVMNFSSAAALGRMTFSIAINKTKHSAYLQSVDFALCFFMLGDENKSLMLSVITLNVDTLSLC